MKRYIVMTLYFVIFVLVLMSDERENRLDKINIGYENEDTVSFLENTVRSDGYYQDMTLLTVKIYDSEENMMRRIKGDDIDILFLTDRSLLYEKDMTNVKVVLEYRVSNGDTLMICVADEALEGNPENILKLLRNINVSKEKNFLLIEKDEWENMYNTEGYDEEIRSHMMFDFQDELLK